YGPNVIQYKANRFPYNEPFVQSLELKNIHFISQSTTYMVRFTQKIRHILSTSDLGSFIGFQPRYYSIPYIESTIGRNNPTANPLLYATVAIAAPSTIVDQETEQRNKTVRFEPLLCLALAFLKRPGIFNPWGYVQKRIISRGGLSYTIDAPMDLEKLPLEERVKRLEALDMFLNNHVIGIPFGRDVKNPNKDDPELSS
ncbi:29270_t:CDS:2, partial [Racocetra persica]